MAQRSFLTQTFARQSATGLEKELSMLTAILFIGELCVCERERERDVASPMLTDCVSYSWVGYCELFTIRYLATLTH